MDATKKGYHDEGSAKVEKTRGENNKEQQLPTKPMENVSTDRGKFKLG